MATNTPFARERWLKYSHLGGLAFAKQVLLHLALETDFPSEITHEAERLSLRIAVLDKILRRHLDVKEPNQ